MSEKKTTDVKNDVETRLTRLEALMRIVKRHMIDVDERVGAMPHHEEMSKIEKTGFASIKMLIGAAAMFAIVTVSSWVTAATVEVPSDHVAVFGYPTVGYVDSSGNLVLGGSFVALINGTNITSGNIAVARITNAAATLGPSIGGNIPVAAVTNAAATVGPSIGGNVHAAAITNALATSGPQIGGNIPVAAVSNVFNTAGVKLAAYNVHACTNYTYLNLVGGMTYIQTNLAGLAGPTNLFFFTNGVLVNVVAAP